MIKAIRLCALCAPLFVSAVWGECARPSNNDFRSTTLWQIPAGFEPIQVEILPDGRILVASRLGKVVQVDLNGNGTRELLDLNVDGKTSDGVNTSTLGILGLVMSPNFAHDSRLYLYYAPPGKPSIFRLSRFLLDDAGLHETGTILEIPRDYLVRDHTGGSMAFDGHGNLFLSTGDNSMANASSGFSPIDEAGSQGTNDSQRSAANTNDLRGKILRIRPLPAPLNAMPGPGVTYAIPKGNLREAYAHLWPGAMADKVRPEIYTMGHRNPFRLAVDQRRGWVHWGEVGPDAMDAQDARGPVGHDEFNIAIRPGNYGWPMFVGFNLPYRRYDFLSGKSGDWFNPIAPVNTSPRNSGVAALPPARPPIVAMTKQGEVVTADKRILASWGPSGAAIGGAFFDAALVDPDRSEGALPAFFHGKLFIAEFVNRWIKVLSMDDTAGLVSAESFLPGVQHSRIIDLKIPSDGSLYVLEWGQSYQPNDALAKLTRITYHGPYPNPEQCGVTPLEGTVQGPLLDNSSGPFLRLLQPGLTVDVPRMARSLNIIAPDGRILLSTSWAATNRPNRITIPRQLAFEGTAWIDFLPRSSYRYPLRNWLPSADSTSQ